MSSAPLLGIYSPGTTALHRMSAGWKLVGVFVLGVIVVVAKGPTSALCLFGLAVVLAAWSRMDRRTAVRGLRPILFVAALLAIYQTWQRGWPTAVEVVADLLALVITATVLTATTPIDELLDTITRALHPFRRIGVNPDKVALAFSLMIRAVPGTLEIAQETRAAATARGLGRNPRALLVPMVIRTVAQARATGDALAARGIGEDD